MFVEIEEISFIKEDEFIIKAGGKNYYFKPESLNVQVPGSYVSCGSGQAYNPNIASCGVYQTTPYSIRSLIERNGVEMYGIFIKRDGRAELYEKVSLGCTGEEISDRESFERLL